MSDRASTGRAFRLLGRHVGGRAHDNARLGRDRGDRGFGRRQLDQFRETEVEHFGAAVARDDDVGRLDVAMDDAVRVRDGKGRCDLDGIIQSRGNRQGPLGEQPVERRAVHQLHRDERRSGILADLVDRDDVGMVQCGRRLRLANEAAMTLGVHSRFMREHFDRHRTPELRIDCAIDHTHPAAPDFSFDAVMRDGIGHQRLGAGSWELGVDTEGSLISPARDTYRTSRAPRGSHRDHRPARALRRAQRDA